MTHSNPKDPQAELRKQLEQIMMLAKIGYDTDSNWQYDTTQSIEALFQAHQLELLTELLGELPSDTIVTSKYGYNSEEKKYGYRIGIAEAKSVIKRRLSKTNDGGQNV